MRDLGEIAVYVETQSGSRDVAERFVEGLIASCEQLASLQSIVGRPRDELRSGYRSSTKGNYIIFFRYRDDDCPRSHLEVLHVLQGARDLGDYFAKDANESGEGE